MTRNGRTSNILDKQFNLEPDDGKAITEFLTVNYCTGKASDIATKVRVEADMIPVGGSCFAEDDYEWTPIRPPCDVTVQPYIKCTLEDDMGRTVACLDYIEEIDDPEDQRQCVRTVTYDVTMVNTGLACLTVESVTGRLRSKTDALDITPDSEVVLCPGETYVIEVETDQDLCDDDLEEEIIIEINGGPAEVCGGFGSLTYIPVPEFPEECSVALDLSCTTPSGGPCQITRDVKSECNEHPGYMEFKLSGGSCDKTTNQQNGKFVCNDSGAMSDVTGAYVVVESAKNGKEPLFSATVARGQRFKIGNGYKKLDANLEVHVYQSKGGKLLQRMNLHASCSEPLHTNDVFGGITLMAFGNGKNGYEAANNEFLISYEVTNSFDTIALMEEIIFYQNGNEVARTYLDLRQVQPGTTFARSEQLELTASSNADVELTAALFAESLSALDCNTDAGIVIPVVEPEPEPEPECEPIKCEGGFPHAFKMKFTGGDCDDSDNHQTYWCTDHKEIGDWARIIVGDEAFKEIYFEGDVKKGHEFEFKTDKAFKEMIAVKVMTKDYYGQWVVAQIVKFLPTCEKPLYLGDIFGAVEVAGWKIKGHGSVYFPKGHKC